MLTNLIINNFTIVDKTDIKFESGFSVMTGETGAGKSILLDAVSLILGEKNTRKIVMEGKEKAEITGVFNVESMLNVQSFLREKSFESDDQECIIKRVIDKDNKSIAYINGNRCTLKDLKSLGDMLVSIHGQNEHQMLIKPKYQATLLDNYLLQKENINKVFNLYHQLKNKKQTLKDLKNNLENNLSKFQLLSYQINEISELNIKEFEFEELEKEYAKITNASGIIQNGEIINQILKENEDTNIFSLLNKIKKSIDNMKTEDDEIVKILNVLETLKENTEEIYELNKEYLNSLNIDEERLFDIDNRISKIVEISRKHKVNPENLYKYQSNLEKELSDLNYSEEDVAVLEKEIKFIIEQYKEYAEKVRKERIQTASQLSEKVSAELEKMNMPENSFKIRIEQKEISEDNFSEYGCDTPVFLLAPNIGQTHQPIEEIASGGELSRTSLALQVICNISDVPTIIFDEVDTGISGITANVVGNLLRKLGQKNQVFCITHLAQVASKGNNHYVVSKEVKNNKTYSYVKRIKENDSVYEIARLLGADSITKEALENAKKLLENKGS